MAEALKRPKLTKEFLIHRAVDKLGGRKSYYRKLSKHQLEALLNSDEVVQAACVVLVRQLMDSAQTNLSVNGRRLVAENKAEKFEGHYQEELHQRTYIEQQYYKVLEQLRQLLDVEESEIIRATKIATRLLKQMLR